MTKPIPEGFHSVTPQITFRDSGKAIAFYKEAFGAVERSITLLPGTRVMVHGEIRIGDSVLMMSDELSQNPTHSAEEMRGSPVSFYLYVQDADAAFARALAAGATGAMTVQDMFWGDRLGVVKDPFGHYWTLATHKKDATPEEIKKGLQVAYPQPSESNLRPRLLHALHSR